MMSVMYSWLAAAAVSPFVAILSCWTLAIFRSYRSEWRTLDIFLLALTAVEGLSAAFCFGHSVLAVIRPALDGSCQFLVWGLTATRAFQVSALASLMVDRALSGGWSKDYRSNVRQNQIRYHVVVLGVVSSFVGVTTVFARTPSPPGTCSLHPLEWDLKFAGLLACAYGLLLLISFVCGLVLQFGRCRSRGVYSTSSRLTMATEGSTEWPVTASLCAMSLAVNHVPYLVLNCLGMWRPAFWTEWLDCGVLWLRLAEGLLAPLVLLAADPPHRGALRNMLRGPGRVYSHLSDLGGFRMQIGDHLKAGGFPPAPYVQRLRWSPASLPSLQSLQPLDVDTLRRGYGSRGYTTLLHASSCDSSTLGSVTTDAADDFEFRRPSVLALFDPHPSKRLTSDLESDGGQPVDYVRRDVGDEVRLMTSIERKRQPPRNSPEGRESHQEDQRFSLQDSLRIAQERLKSSGDGPHIRILKGLQEHAYPRESHWPLQESERTVQEIQFSLDEDSSHEDYSPSGRRRDTPTPFSEDGDTCSCTSSEDPTTCSDDSLTSRSSETSRDVISRNMINIILSYGGAGCSSATSTSSSALDSRGPGSSSEEMSSLTSTESSDADSVHSVIIRQRVDQRGRVSQSDITIAERKIIRCLVSDEEGARGKDIIFSEYL